MRIAEVELTNWARFRGTHRREFGPGVHAVTAKHNENELRSNWLGKSSFMWAASMFILYGVKMPAHRYEDDWINESESSGVVYVRYTNGLEVKRTRERGSSTKLEVTWQGVESIGDRAQEVINSVVGMTKEDFESAYYFEQKMMSAGIGRGQSSALHERARAWFELNKLQDAFEDSKEKRKTLAKEETSLVVMCEGSDDSDVDTSAPLATWEAAKKAAAELQEELDETSDHVVRFENAQDFEAELEESRLTKSRLTEMNPKKLVAEEEALREAYDAAKDEYAVAVGELDTAAGNACGDWSGVCPVTDEICSVKEEVHDFVTTADELVERARKQRDARAKAMKSELLKLRAAEAKTKEAKKLHHRLSELRESVKARKPDYDFIQEHGEPEDVSELRQRVQQAWSDEGAARAEYENAVRLNKAHADQKKIHRKHAKRLTEVRAEMATLTKAMAVFKRAQRSIAETALDDIERDSNALLGEAGIDLAIGITWERPIKGLAAHCDACGHSFGKSQKAKRCPDCDSPRPQKRKEELEVTPTDRSGAADDIAGIGFKIGAAAWLRRKRQSPWSVAFIDEPFSALDGANTPALAAQLTTMLSSRFGFEQAFITAHSRAVLDALPERFEITASAEGSSF